MKIAKTARINVRGFVFLNAVDANMLRRKGAECVVVLQDGAVWDVNGHFHSCQGARIMLSKNAQLSTGDAVRINTGAFIACHKKIAIGNYVALGWLVFVYGTDFHPIYNSEGKRVNEDKEVVIEDHVWIGLKSAVLKGARVKTGSVIGANSLVSGKTPARTINVSSPARPVIEGIRWTF